MEPQTKKQATLKSLAPQLVVEDVVKTAEYYRDILGFTLLGYWMDPPVYSIVQRDGVEIHFGKAKKSGVSNSTIRSGAFDLYIWVSDIDAVFEELKAAGAKIIEGPVKRIYDSTELTVEDCNGYSLVFAV
jgi:catechol 2,3-dioxygenase-like lactoylglutathione lyase family enzyme